MLCIHVKPEALREIMFLLCFSIKSKAIFTTENHMTIWASPRENLSSVVCEQQRHRPACPSAQPDQHLCYSRFGKYHI